MIKQAASPVSLSDTLNDRFRQPLMSYFLRRVAARSEAEDLTQQVFVRVLAAAPGTLDNPGAYVFTIASNLLKDRHRKRGSVGELQALDPALVANLVAGAMEDITPERVLIGRATLADLLRALDELGERTRDIFILFRLENMKQADIAALYGIGRSTVEKHVMRATLHLGRWRRDAS